MKRGTKRQPTEIKLARGTLRKHRDGDPKLAPKVVHVLESPPPPDTLGEQGRAAWIEYVPQMIAAGYFASIDIRAFTNLCRAYDEVYACDLVLEEEGNYSTSDKGYQMQHPAVNQRFKWLDIIRRYESEFWLTPTARSGKQTAGKANGVARRQRA